MTTKQEIEQELRQRELIFNKYNGKCAFCGTKLKSLWHISPIIPTELAINKKGKLTKTNDEIENKLPSCVSCNSSRIQLSYGAKTMTVEQFKESLLSSLEFIKKNADYKKAIRFGLITETNNPIIFHFEKHNNK